MSSMSDLSKEWADRQVQTEGEAFEKAMQRIAPRKIKEPYTSKESECNKCCHHYVCGMCTTHKAEHYEGCDFFMPYLRPSVPLVVYDTETEYRNAWNEAVALHSAIKKSVEGAQAEYETSEHKNSGLIE